MEPERKIEKRLRAYAKKRRAQAGDPLKLHPATRRRLLDEVARATPKADEPEESVSLWELFRRQWAMLLGFALVIFFVTSMFLPALSSAKKKSQRSETYSKLKQIRVAAQVAADKNHGKLPAVLDELTNNFISNKTLTDSESGKPFVYVAGGAKLDDLSSNAMLAYSPADKKGHAVLFADGHVESVNGAQLAKLNNQVSTELAFAKEKDSARRQIAEAPVTLADASGNATAASTVSGALKSESNLSAAIPGEFGSATRSRRDLAINVPTAPALDSDRLDLAKKNAVQFTANAANNFALGVQNNFKNTVAPAKTALVLANFQVQQNGNAIRVVDADGSVYDGALQPESAVAQNEPVPAAAPPALAPKQAELQKNVTNREESQSAQNYFFRVMGTNRTLKQAVVFNGNLVANGNVMANGQQKFDRNFGGGGGAGGGQQQAALANQLPWRPTAATLAGARAAWPCLSVSPAISLRTGNARPHAGENAQLPASRQNRRRRHRLLRRMFELQKNRERKPRRHPLGAAGIQIARHHH
jgi:prepilin-type processing-associated H-X9-DG protein